MGRLILLGFGILPAVVFSNPRLRGWFGYQMKVPNVRSSSDAPLYILFNTQDISRSVSDHYLFALIKEHFKKRGIESRWIPGHILIPSKSQRGIVNANHASALLGTKFVIDMNVRLDGIHYILATELILIKMKETGEGVFKPERKWSGHLFLNGLTKEELDENISKFLRREVDRALRECGQEFEGGLSVTSESVQVEWQSLSETDVTRVVFPIRKNRPARLAFGATAGTPALGNLNLSVWGIGGLPLLLGVSGMYFGAQNRGIQTEVGFVLGSHESFTQAVGIALCAFNETTQRIELSNPQAMGAEQVIVERLYAYLGPVYSFNWRWIRLQIGFARTLSVEVKSNNRLLFQVGFTPSVEF